VVLKIPILSTAEKVIHHASGNDNLSRCFPNFIPWVSFNTAERLSNHPRHPLVYNFYLSKFGP
jgi:hypothetical protein